MRRLLIVAPAFPPHPSPATHRARFLARHGRGHGWDVEVLTVRPDRYLEKLDHELAALVPQQVRVTRVGALSGRWTRRLGVSDLGLRSYPSLRRALHEICAAAPPDLLYFPGGPFYPFRLGPAMRRRFGVPYALDFTDPWVHPLPREQRRPWKKAYWAHTLARTLEPRAVEDAALLVAVSDATLDGVRARHPRIPADRYLAEPFGFDASDFAAVRAAAAPNRFWKSDDGAVHLAYVGAVPPSMGETVRALLAGLASLRERRPELGRRLRLHFLGTSYDPVAREGLVAPLAREAGVADVVFETPIRLPYVDALRALVQADGLLALGSTERHYTASKIFNCILAGRPMLTLFHEASPVVDFVRTARAGELVTYDDVARVGEKVSEIADALGRLAAGRVPAPDERSVRALEPYSAEHMTERILAACEAAIGDRPFAGDDTLPGRGRSHDRSAVTRASAGSRQDRHA